MRRTPCSEEWNILVDACLSRCKEVEDENVADLGCVFSHRDVGLYTLRA